MLGYRIEKLEISGGMLAALVYVVLAILFPILPAWPLFLTFLLPGRFYMKFKKIAESEDNNPPS